ncbi:UBX domain-containing protein 2B [Drosophila bipectinata]|uniref:UBX domain-containing protein 2B n=1 Tax=Drosophila bipectinata TaxID=42026 RepID=UPI001C8A7052|nr:UBX domain-containing protein 2B [Drosophila bipectinata]
MTDEQKLNTFMQRHGVREEVARRYLSANNWALDLASNIYESDTAAKNSPDKSQRSKKSEKSEKPDPTIAESSHRDLQSLRSQHSRKQSDSDGYQAEMSVSGSSSAHDVASNKRVAIEDSTPALTTNDSDRSLRVWGHGIPLGSAHPINPPPARATTEDSDTEPTDDEHTIVVLHLWSEGFSLDDGTLRPYAVPENERFLRAVLRGDFPIEMLDNRPRVELSVQDHTNERFRTLSRKQFLGPGRSLVNPSPTLALPIPGSQVAMQAVQLNEGAAITTVQMRLADGSRVTGRFNLTHNIGDLYRYARLARPQFSDRSFVLMTSFPRQELQETDTRTLGQANLCNVVVIQHLNEEQEDLVSSDSSE